MDEAQVAVEQVTPESTAETPVQSQEAPVEAVETKTETPPPVQEKMISASHASKIASREAKQAAEKARQEAFAEFQQQQIAKDTTPAPATSMGGIPQIPPEMLQQQIMEAAHRMSTQMTANKMAQDFEAKINAEIQEDPDFGDLYDKMNIAQHPELVIWMNGMDNSAKVVKDLAQNPAKFANILMLAKSGLGDLAQSELTKLSASIKTNQAALEQPKVKEPLDQLSASSIGIDSGSMSVSDFMQQDWLRG